MIAQACRNRSKIFFSISDTYYCVSIYQKINKMGNPAKITDANTNRMNFNVLKHTGFIFNKMHSPSGYDALYINS
jgi:hypothetical protein